MIVGLILEKIIAIGFNEMKIIRLVIINTLKLEILIYNLIFILNKNYKILIIPINQILNICRLFLMQYYNSNICDVICTMIRLIFISLSVAIPYIIIQTFLFSLGEEKQEEES